MARLAILALLACRSCGLSVQQHSRQLGVSDEHKVAKPMFMYKQDCWQKRAASLVQGANVPGAGIDKFTPFETVEKDGYLEADCVKDYMYTHGDKFGDNKASYKLAKLSNVSIVHYSAHVAKEDRKPMTPKVCFEFCRTVPNMGFFGIVNGRGCYCTPYYKPMESGSSNCDSTCEGDATLMCGGKDKSTVFGMHMCANTAQDLTDAAKNAGATKLLLRGEINDLKGLSETMQASATKKQASFGAVGDSATTGLMQSAKVFAGTLKHAAEDAQKLRDKLGSLQTDAGKITVFTDPKEVTKAEGIVASIEKTNKDGEKAVEALRKLKKTADPPTAAANASQQYYPMMYFVDKEFEAKPQTCGGDVIGKPFVGGDLDQCATACDAANGCVGFSHFGGFQPLRLCFLFGKFKTAFYYTCDNNEVKCMAKFSEFEGTTLKPDPSGKCDRCLKKLTKADRCFK